MKTKIVFGLLTFLLVVFIGLLFIPGHRNLKVITSPKIFSILKSSDNEYIEIELLVNQKDTYYFNKDYISSMSIKSEFDEEIIPLVIHNISYSNNQYDYENDLFYLVNLSVSIGFESEEFLISFEKAFLDILYDNEENLKLYVGEFNYLFNDNLNSDLGISNLTSTVHNNEGINTVSGIFIELYNRSTENLVINRLHLGSASVSFNNYYLSEIYEEPDLFETIEEILVIENYDFNQVKSSVNKSILLRENQSVMLYVPLSYLGEIDFIHRFFFELKYFNNEGESSFVIDDIPYINTSIFQSDLEESYIIYESPN